MVAPGMGTLTARWAVMSVTGASVYVAGAVTTGAVVRTPRASPNATSSGEPYQPPPAMIPVPKYSSFVQSLLRGTYCPFARQMRPLEWNRPRLWPNSWRNTAGASCPLIHIWFAPWARTGGAQMWINGQIGRAHV